MASRYRKVPFFLIVLLTYLLSVTGQNETVVGKQKRSLAIDRESIKTFFARQDGTEEFVPLPDDDRDLPNLGIDRDWIPEERLWSYSGVIEFPQQEHHDTLRQDNRGRLVTLARMAHRRMIGIHRRTGDSNNMRPRVTVALAIDNRVYFATSWRRHGNVRNIFMEDPVPQNQEIHDLLISCQTQTNTLGHQNEAACGEPNVIALYMTLNEETTFPHLTPGLLVAWYQDNDNREGQVIPPCQPRNRPDGTPRPDGIARYGCLRFLEINLPNVEHYIGNDQELGDLTDQFFVKTRDWRQSSCLRNT